MHALIGQNGAGKSTHDQDPHRRLPPATPARSASTGSPSPFASPQEAQAAGISTIYQEINLVPYRSVTENICLGREPRRFGLLDWRRMHAEAPRRCAAFDVDGRRAPAAA